MSRIARHPRVLWRRSGDRVVLRDRGPRGETHVLEGAGALLWLQLGRETGADQLIAGLAALSGADGTRVAADLVGFIDDLRSRGLLVVTER